jgi:anti-sigma factor RsiW
MSECQRITDLLQGERPGELEPAVAGQVEAHLAQCSSCRSRRAEDTALAAMIRSLPVTPAPPDLRRRIERDASPRPRLGRWLGRPWIPAAAAVVLIAVALWPWIPFRSRPAADPIETLVLSAVGEYENILLQLHGESADVTDPAKAFASVQASTRVRLPPALAGDPEYPLVAARPTVLAHRRAATAVLGYEGRPACAYFVLAGEDLPMPEASRVQIEQYRPYARQVGGFRAIYWKQGELALLMVTDLDETQSRQMFLRIRKAL